MRNSERDRTTDRLRWCRPARRRWGTEWKRAVVRHYNHTLAINNQGSVMAYRQNYLDLDPTYRRSPTAARSCA